MKVKNIFKYHYSSDEKIPNPWEKSSYYIPGIPIRNKDAYVGGYKDDEWEEIFNNDLTYYSSQDREILKSICTKLINDPDVDESEIDVEVNRAEVTLTGIVLDEWMKVDAELDVRNNPDVLKVYNRLEVIKTGGDKNSGREHPYYHRFDSAA